MANQIYKKGQEWGEVSRNPNPVQAMAEEMNEMLDQFRGERKNKGACAYDSHEEEIKSFGKKGSDGGHFWHPESKRGYSEKGGTKGGNHEQTL